MADNTIYYDDEEVQPQKRNLNDATATPDYDAIYFENRRAQREEQLQTEMDPYRLGLNGGDIESQADAITRKYRLPQSNVIFDGWKNGEGPGAHYMADTEKQILQAVANKRIGQYNSALSDMRNRLNAFGQQQYAQLNNEYETAKRAYYEGRRGPDGKLLYKEPPVFDQQKLNDSIEAFKQEALQISTKDIKDIRVREAVGRHFQSDVANYARHATADNIKREARDAKQSYAQYGKSIANKAVANPTTRLPDMVQEFSNNVATGVNTNLLTPEEGINAITEFSKEAKKLKRQQLKSALKPQDGLDPAQNAEKAATLIKDHIEQGVITPAEAQNMYQESVSQSLAKNESKNVSDTKSIVKESLDTKVLASQMDVAQKAVIEGLKAGIPPDSETLNQLYSNADPELRKKLDTDLGKAFTSAKFSALPTAIRKELIDNPDLLSNVFYLNDEKDYEALQKQNEALNKSIQKDPVKVMLDQKLIEDVVPVDTSSYDGMVTSLRNRSVLAMKVKAHTGVANTGLLDEETELLGKSYANAGISQKADIVGAIYEAYGENADTVYKKLDDKGYRSLSLAGNYYVVGNRAAGVDIINGIELDKQNKGLIPSDNQLYAAAQTIDPINKVSFPVYSDDAGISDYATGETRVRTLQAAKYIYASKLAKEGILSTASTGKDSTAADNFRPDLWKESMIEALNGGTIRVGKSDVEPPFLGATKEDVEGFLKTVTLKDVQSIRQFKRMGEQGKIKVPVSVDGKSQELTDILLNDITWVSKGDGNYVMGLNKSPGLAGTKSKLEILVDDKTGEPVVVNLRKLMQGKDYVDPETVPHVDPKYTDLLTQVTASEAAAKEWSRIREKDLIVNDKLVKAKEADKKANFVMQEGGGDVNNPDNKVWQ